MGLTIKELLDKKAVIEERKKKRVVINIEGVGEFIFRTPEPQDYEDGEAYLGGGYLDEYLVYECCVEPNLKAKEALDGYGATNGVEMVNAVFMQGHRRYIVEQLIKAAGFEDGLVTVIDDKVKN